MSSIGRCGSAVYTHKVVLTHCDLYGLIACSLTTKFLCFLHKDTTGSSLGRTFFGLLPNTYISIFCSLNFWAAVGYVFISTVISLPTVILMQSDD